MIRLSDGHADVARRAVVRGDTCEPLTAKEAELLAYLAARAGEAVTEDTLLADVWGYKPGLETRAVYFTFRRLRAKVEADPHHPRHLFVAHGGSYRFEPVPEAPALPAEPPGFVGRAEALRALDAATGEPGALVTVLGFGGIGKTRLARRWAGTRAGTAWCDLAQAHGVGEAAFALATALGAPLPPSTSAADAPFAAGRLLRACAAVVLDNVEQIEGMDAFVAALRAVAPAVRVVATSRVRLGLRGEAVLELEPLPAAEAAALFRARARVPTEGDPAVEAIAERLDGIPLAVELAAARTAVLRPADLLARLAVPVLRTSDRDAPARHGTMDAALAWSWDGLPPDGRDALARLGVFRGGFDLPAAEAVLGPEALDRLEALRDHSLVRMRDGRLDTWGVVREWLAGRPEAVAAGAEARDAHARWYAALADRLAEEPGARQLAGLAAERANLLAAWEHARGRDPELAGRIALALDVVAQAQGPAEGRLARFDEALAHALPAALRGDLLRGRGRVRGQQGDAAGSLDDLQAAVALAGEDGARRGLALTELGMRHAAAGALDEAEASFLGALDAHARGGDTRRNRRGAALAATMRGWVLAERRDPAAEPLLREAAQRHADLEDPVRVALTRSYVGTLLRDTGRLDLAEAELTEALRAYDAAGYRQNPVVRYTYATVAHLRGDFDLAEERYRDSITRATEFRSPYTLALAHAWLAILDAERGDVSAGADALAAARRVAPAGEVLDTMLALARARLALAEGHPVELGAGVDEVAARSPDVWHAAERIRAAARAAPSRRA
ncbi:MAG: ATP-binding protein [Myxococcota bacterium]